MTNFRDKARAIKAEGEAVRGDYSPKGTPAKIYSWWLDNSPSIKAARINAGTERENFCHYWRVVAIWAGLLFVGLKFVEFASSKVGQVILAAVAVLSILALFSLPAGPGWGLFILYLVFGGVAGAVSGAVTAAQTVEEKRQTFTAQETLLLRASFVLGFFLSIPFFIITWLGFHHGKALERVIIASVVAIGVGALGLLLWAAIIDFGWVTTLLFVLGIIGGFAVFIGGILGLVALTEAHKARRQAIKDRTIKDYIEATGQYPTDDVFYREPGRIKKFFSALGDVIVLIAQVVRVNKWKICPIVEVK